jgi:hypothetical protein
MGLETKAELKEAAGLDLAGASRLSGKGSE